MKISIYMHPYFTPSSSVDLINPSLVMFTRFPHEDAPRKVELYTFFVPMALRKCLGYSYVDGTVWNVSNSEQEFLRAVKEERF